MPGTRSPRSRFSSPLTARAHPRHPRFSPLALLPFLLLLLLLLRSFPPVHAALDTPPRKFIVLASQRTGSTLLALLLNEHPQVHCMQEIFLPGAYNTSVVNLPSAYKHWAQHRTVIEEAFAGRLAYTDLRTHLTEVGLAKPGPVLARGFKHMYNHMLLTVREYFFAWAAANHLTVVHLHRNPIESFVSVRIAERNNVWHSLSADAAAAGTGAARELAPDTPIVVNVTRLARSLAHLTSEFTYFRTRLTALAPAVTYAVVDYANLRDRRDSTLQRMWRLLGVPSFDRTLEPATVSLRRLSTLACSQRIANWAEVRAALGATHAAYVRDCEDGANGGLFAVKDTFV